MIQGIQLLQIIYYIVNSMFLKELRRKPHFVIPSYFVVKENKTYYFCAATLVKIKHHVLKECGITILRRILGAL